MQLFPHHLNFTLLRMYYREEELLHWQMISGQKKRAASADSKSTGAMTSPTPSLSLYIQIAVKIKLPILNKCERGTKNKNIWKDESSPVEPSQEAWNKILMCPKLKDIAL